MGVSPRSAITFAEVLAVSGGIDESTSQPVVVLTVRPITGLGWRHINYALGIENAEALVGRLHAALDSPLVKPHRRSGSNSADAACG
jgi:hypothetical protein